MNPDLFPRQMEIEIDVQACFELPATRHAACLETLDRISEQTWQTWFRTWLQALNSALPAAETYELSLRLTDDDQMQTLNQSYRQQDRPTDVLAFAALEADFPHTAQMPLYLGDIAISVETAIRQAQQQQHSETIELAWLATHGLLHLLGWDHPDDDSLLEMIDRQTALLQLVGLDSPKRWA